jgi:4-amino-4-deoxy-L-arabinose transferase-like glycosyltransferase
MKPLLWWPGPVLAAAIVLPWAVAVSGVTDGSLIEDTATRLVSGEEGRFALPGYHLFLLPFLIFPATYALPAAARLAWDAVRAPNSDAAQSPIRFLLAWAAPIFIVFEFAPTKLAHYVLPAYPAIALLCGAGLAAMHGGRWRTAHPAGVVLYAVYGAVLVALMAAAATFMPGDLATDLRRAVSAALVGLGLLALSFTLLIMAPRPDVRAGVLIVCALIFSFSLRERLLPEARLLNVSSEVVTALTRARLTPREDRPLWVVGYDELSLVFLIRSSIHLADPETAGANAQPGDALVVEGREMQRMSSALEIRGLRFEGGEPPVRGLSLGRGERVALFVGRVAEPSEERADGQQQSP